MLKYKGTYIKMFPLMMKKFMVEQYGKADPNKQSAFLSPTTQTH